MWSNWHPRTLLVVVQNSIATLENSLKVPYKVKCHLHDLAFGYLPKKNENICPYKKLYVNVYSNLIHNLQKLETTQITTTCWMNKHWYIDTMEYDSEIKRNELMIKATMWMNANILCWVKKISLKKLHVLSFYFNIMLETEKIQGWRMGC